MMAQVGGTSTVVARGDLQDRIEALLSSAEPAAACVLLTGLAGIGKTALWAWALDHARACGQRVLVSRCLAAESAMPWVGLTDLLAGCDGLVDDLPSPQCEALRVVTLRQQAGTPPPDERAVGTALTSVVMRLSAEGPLLLGVDDIGHLDSVSGKALAFMLRRLPVGTPVRLVATSRTEDVPALTALADRTTVVGVGPLPLAGVFQLLRRRLGVVFPRPTLVRIHEAAQGNPLYALEIARAVGGMEIDPVPGAPLELPGTLRGLVADRISRLSVAVRTVVAAAAVSVRLRVSDIDSGALAEAVQEGLLVLDAGVVRPSHPLLASAAYASLDATQRSQLHRGLAGASTDSIERARHLALAATGPDRAVAEALDVATMDAIARGAADAAVDLARLAVGLTADGDPARVGRLQRLADALFRAGDSAGAAEAQRAAVAASPPGPPRAGQRIRLAEIVVEASGWNAAVPLLLEAVAEAGDDALLAAEAHLTIAAVSYDDLRSADEHATRAARLIEAIAEPDPAILAGTLVQAAGAAFRAGHGLDHEGFRRAIALEAAHPTRRLSDRADAGYAALLKYADDLDSAERLFTALLREAEDSGDLSSVAYVRLHLPQIALWRGDLAVARRLAEEHLTVAESAGLVAQIASARFLVGLVACYDGRVTGARQALTDELQRAVVAGTLWDQQRLHGALGLLCWSVGDGAAAVEHLDRWDALVARIGLGEPGYSRYHLDYVEALISAHRHSDAAEFLDRLAGQAARTDRGYAHAVVATGRALLASARGGTAGAQELIAVALRRHDSLPLRFDRARCLLVAGHVYRRAKAKLAARTSLAEAHAEFQAMGARPWAARAAYDLARVNIRPPAPAELSTTERRVADLAAQGLTNQQVADALFMARKTVEANIARVYRKLGISSRAELGARIGSGQAG